MNNKPIGLEIIIGVLFVVAVFFGYQYLRLTEEVKNLRAGVVNTELNQKVLDFNKMFIEKVLKADREVDFETRLTLENAVRGLKDEEIMSAWQKFVGSKTELEAQNNVKNLLGLLANKIR
jgi:hypothetical protein